MRTLICILAFAAAATGPALAETAPNAAAQAKDAVMSKSARTVFVCDTTTATRRAFTREFGVMEFVTADRAVAKGETWSAPKCVTASEARRLIQLTGKREQVASLR
jgi:hypothetical protein